MRIILSFFFILTGITFAESPWIGKWDTVWRVGRAEITFREEGNKIIGEYPVYEGVIEAEVNEKGFLVGTWKEPKLEGKFFFAMSDDQQSFSGRFDSGEWWNGKRVDPKAPKKIYSIFLEPNLTSPRETIKSFVNAFGYIQNGDSEFILTAEKCINFPEEIAIGPMAERVQLITEFFHSIDHTTFRVWGLPGDGSDDYDAENDETALVTLKQLGTRKSMTVSFTKKERDGEQVWLLDIPSLPHLISQNEVFLEKRGMKTFDPLGYLKLRTPRDTLKAFLVSSKATTDDEREMLAQTMDLSGVSEGIQEQEIELYTQYLKSIIDRAGYIIWQEIPNDPNATVPVIYYAHPVGDVVLAPYPDGNGGRVWKFTGKTLNLLPELYEAVKNLPIVDGVSPAARKPLYFQIRESLYRISPALLKRHLYLENWQWFGLLVIIGAGWVIARILTKLTSTLLHWRFDESKVHLKKALESNFLKPLFLTFFSLILKFGLSGLGLPEEALNALLILSSVMLVLGGAWSIYNLIDIIGTFFLRRAKNSESSLDDILVSLIASLCKIFVIVGAFVLLAEVLHLPYRTVLASLGIGGLAIAIAARDTLANFFGSAVLLADRPFRRGDLVEFGDVTGTVSKVGLRSTHIRTLHDSMVIIPNNLLANERINNLKHRRRRHVRSIISVTYDTTPEKLDTFRDTLLELIAKQPNGQSLERHAGIWKFSASSIDIEIFCYIAATNRGQEYSMRHKLFVSIVKLAEEMGIEFAIPTRKLYLENGVTPPDSEGS